MRKSTFPLKYENVGIPLPSKKLDTMEKKRLILKGRRHKTRPCLTLNNHPLAILAVWFILLSSLPAFYSCNRHGDAFEDTDLKECTVCLKSADVDKISGLDVFFFNDDRLRKLDSWQHLDSAGSGTVECASRQGKKIVVAIANARLTDEECRKIRSYEDLGGLHAELQSENPDSPVMSGEGKVSAGNGRYSEIVMEPLLCEIVLNSISCDFHLRPYAGKMLENVRVYLTNVSGRMPYIGHAPAAPESILNHGHLSDEDIRKFEGKCLIHTEMTDIGESVVYPETKLYCYENLVREEGLATPFTRLVIEGELDGKKTYYPLNINRGIWSDGESNGLARNRSYTYDITLTRRGVNDPDNAIEMQEVQCNFQVKPWKDKERRTITF